MTKLINILHPTPKGDKTAFAIIPIGMYLNRPLQEAAPNSEICFWQDWRHEKRRIVQITKFRINTPEFTFILRCVYGERMTIAKLFEQWEAECINEGIGLAGFSREEALVVEVANLE